MVATDTVHLLARLGVTRSLSRPRVSNDNPFSESQFKTLKYRPEFPDRFSDFDSTRDFCRLYFPWYNDEHRHSGISMLTPADVFFRRSDRVLEQRNSVLATAWEMHPDRFPNGKPAVRPLDRAVYINKPVEGSTAENAP